MLATKICLDFACYFFFFNDTATTEIYTLSLHDALPISGRKPSAGLHETPPVPRGRWGTRPARPTARVPARTARSHRRIPRSEEHTSELQSHLNLVCRLLLEKKKKQFIQTYDLRHSFTSA